MAAPNEMRNFALMMAGAFVAILAGIGVVNYVVDPYGVFNSRTYAGFNADKVDAIDHPDISKTYALERVKPKTVLLGNSRVDLGLDPKSPHWPSDSQPVFNLAIPGYSMPTRAQYFEHALAVGNPTRLVMGFSIDDFWPAGHTIAEEAPYVARLRVGADGKPNPNYFFARAVDLPNTLISLPTLSDSLKTPLRQNKPYLSHVTPNGFNPGGALTARTEEIGQRAFMEWKDKDKAPRLIEWAKTRQIDFQPLERILNAAAKRDVEVILFVSPSYVDDYLLFRQVGVQADYDAWKRGLTATVEAARARGVKVALWDFSGVDARSTEPLADKGGKPLTYFYESQHFKPALGEDIIASFFSEAPAYGRLLTKDNVEAVIAEHNAKLDQYIKDHPADAARVSGVVEELAPRKAVQREAQNNKAS